jgi:hypothetical protein
MKKFGTPIGAGPGNANENVGFDGVGAPVPARNGDTPLRKPLGAAVPGLTVTDFPTASPETGLGAGTGLACLFRDGFSVTTFPADAGGATAGADGAGVVVVALELVVGAGAAAHDSVIPTIGSFTGKLNADTGVPGGTFTVNDSFSPPATVTVTTHCSADAAGSEDAAIPAPSAAIVAPTIISFGLITTAASLLPHSSLRDPATPARRYHGWAAPGGRY